MSDELSVKQAAWLGHVRAASEQGMPLAAYAAAHGLSAGALYQAKRVLMDAGAWPRTSPRKGAAATSAFVPIRVKPGSVRACRLSHVSGWSIECEELPPAAWLNEVLRVGRAAA
jgi:hypothetical protein